MSPFGRNLTTLLCGVVFIGEPLLGARFDFQRVGLRAMRGGDHFVMRAFGLGEPGRRSRGR